MSEPHTDERPDVLAVARSAGRSERLRQRRFTLLPLHGSGAVFTGAQGRSPSSPSNAPKELEELISSIAAVGILQPVLVEETPRPDGPSLLRLVTGERRLRAVKWGADNVPDNPHFDVLPAIVCPGPLTEEEISTWQLIENLARDDLRPGELGAALLFERCAVLAQRMADAGATVGDTIWALDNPVARWAALDAQRATATPTIGAPWPDVLRRLGLQFREETCKRLVRALRALPGGLAEDMDAHKVALNTRLSYLKLLDRGRTDAAEEIWAALRNSGRPQLLAAAVREATDNDVDPATAVERAQQLHDDANEARRAAHQPDRPEPAGQPLDAAALLAAQRDVIKRLRAGQRPGRYDAGSIRLGAEQLLDLLERGAQVDVDEFGLAECSAPEAAA